MKNFRIVIVVVLMSCHNLHRDHSRSGQDTAKGDGFYSDLGDWDDSRIPLLKPYELIKLNGRKNWEMSLRTSSIDVAIHNVNKVNVVDSLILVQSGPTQLSGGKEVNEAWFIISPKTNIEAGFARRDEFERTLEQFHIHSPQFFDPTDIYQEFSKKRRIDWGKIPRSY